MKINALLYSDGSERSLSAAIYAAALMKGNPDMSLTIISCSQATRGAAGVVWDEGWSVPGAVAGIDQAVVRQTKKVFTDRHIKVESVVAQCGEAVAEKIVEYAHDGNFNLVIMGTKGPSDLKALVLGSVAHRVVHFSDRPVLLVKKLPAEILAVLDEA